MDDAMLRADCSRCAGLCCVALAFDRGPMFAVDKAAGEPCVHLSARDRCSIHARRAAHGMNGCAVYDCLGAGQAATALFAGRSWRDGAQTARAMFQAFATIRRARELLLLLRTAAGLDLAPAQQARRAELERQCAPPGGWTEQAVEQFDRGRVPAEARAFLAGLKDRVRPVGRPGALKAVSRL